MFLADVVGTVVAPVQVAALEGRTLLIVRPVSPSGKSSGKTRIAIDRVGAGVGDRVLVVDEGNSARQILGDKTAPIKTLVVGFVDYVETSGTIAYDHRDSRSTIA
ncbi:MAG: EutN/CcmL family microcompartment protein [Planctomycetota bacterium]|nr:EutN/CcmL family microcompartment protein [Planctomycetota bacterium]